MRHYYITGVSRGIGKAIAEKILEEDDTLVYGISRKCSIEHKRYQHFHLDLSDIEETGTFFFRKLPDAEQIVLINNAGTLGEIKRFGKLSPLDQIRTYNLNILAPAMLMNNFIAAYQKIAVPKVVVNVTSGAAKSPYDGWSSYCSSKAAIDMMSRVASREQMDAQHPIDVLAIAPGVVETEMQKQLRESEESEFSSRQKFIELHRDGLLYPPEAVAKEFVDLINKPERIEDVVYRIVLEKA